jgi:branched-chain amino acid transport system permease protein
VCLWLYTSHVPILVAVVITMLIGVAMGVVLERLILRPMIGEPIISVIMVTIALASVIKSIVNIIWGTSPKTFQPPVFSAVPVNLGFAQVPEVYLYSLGVAILFLVVFAAFFKFTRVGISMRAVANDQQVAQSMGISVKRVFAISWSIGALVSAVGGILVGNIAQVDTTLGEFGLKVFPAVILGGLESIGGAIIGGLTMGVLENILGSALAKHLGGGIKEIAPFVVLIIILMVKPYGLFGIKEIERV